LNCSTYFSQCDIAATHSVLAADVARTTRVHVCAHC